MRGLRQPCRLTALSLACPAMAKAAKSKKKKARPAKKKAAGKKGARVKAAKPVKPAKKSLPKPLLRLSPPRVRAKRQLRAAPMPPRARRASTSPYDQLPRTPANFQPLTPLSMLERAAGTFPNHPAVIHGAQRYSYADFY